MFFRTNIEDHPPFFLRILNFFEIFCGLGLEGNSETVLYIAPGDRRPFFPRFFLWLALGRMSLLGPVAQALACVFFGMHNACVARYAAAGLDILPRPRFIITMV